MTHYTTIGAVRGGCAHAHRTLHAAERCLVRDQRACRSLPGGCHYSDRAICAYDSREPLPVRLDFMGYARSRTGRFVGAMQVAQTAELAKGDLDRAAD